MIEQLTKLLDRFQHMSDYAETKLGVLVAFNTGVIIGISAIIKDLDDYLQYALIGFAILHAVSLFFAFSGLFAKRNNKHKSSEKYDKKNFYYFAYVSGLTEHSLLDSLKEEYKLESDNEKIEKDLANQIVVLAKNANRKFNFFNLALNFTIAATLSPIGWLIFQLYNNPNWD
jgi:hypothetical protein